MSKEPVGAMACPRPPVRLARADGDKPSPLCLLGQLAILVAVAVVLLLPAPFTLDQLPAVWLGSDLIFSHWPTALLIQRTFAEGQGLPLWNPYYGGGQPLAANPLAALFYPPTLLVHLLPLREYFLVLMLGHLVFAGLGTLLLARRALGLSRLPALVAAISFMATPRLISHLGAGHVTLVQTVSWYPWLALACWATVREPRRWGVWLGVCIALTLLAGHPQMAYYGLLMTVVLAGWLLVKRWWQEGRHALLMSIVGLASAGVIGVLLAAVHLLPLWELTALSTRQLSVRSTEAYPLQQFLTALINQQAPGSSWEYILTPGLAVLILALFALVTRWRKVWPFVLGIVLVAGLAMGNASILYLRIAPFLPELDLFRGLARIWFIALLLFALLAGIGADSLLHSMRRISFRGVVTAVSSLIVLIVALSLVTIDVGLGYTHAADVNIITTPTALARTAAQLAGSGRIYDMQENISQANAVELRIRLADGWDPLLIESYVSYMQQAGGYSGDNYQLHIPYDSPPIAPNARLLGLMNVSVVVSQRKSTDPHLVQAGLVDGTFIYKNTADAGPGYLVSPGENGKPPSLAQLQRLDARVRADIQGPEVNTFTFSSSTGGYFVIATPAFPGWTAELDGHTVPIQQIVGVLPAIKVGPGTHTLRYSYAPLSVYVGAMLSVVGLLAALGWFVVGRRSTSGKQRRPRLDEKGGQPC